MRRQSSHTTTAPWAPALLSVGLTCVPQGSSTPPGQQPPDTYGAVAVRLRNCLAGSYQLTEGRILDSDEHSSACWHDVLCDSRQSVTDPPVPGDGSATLTCEDGSCTCSVTLSSSTEHNDKVVQYAFEQEGACRGGGRKAFKELMRSRCQVQFRDKERGDR